MGILLTVWNNRMSCILLQKANYKTLRKIFICRIRIRMPNEWKIYERLLYEAVVPPLLAIKLPEHCIKIKSFDRTAIRHQNERTHQARNQISATGLFKFHHYNFFLNRISRYLQYKWYHWMKNCFSAKEGFKINRL